MTQRDLPDNIGFDPFTDRLGIANTIRDDGVVLTTHQCTGDECNIFGVVHGAFLFAMADIGMGVTLIADLPGKCRLGSIAINSNFIRAGKPGLLQAETRLLKRGRHVAFLETEIKDGTDEVCAKFSGVFHIHANKDEEKQ